MKKNKKVPLPEKPSLVLSRRATIGWTCFLFFVCAGMFVSGLLVGRGTAPLKFDIAGIQKKLVASREDLKKKEQLRTQGKLGVGKDKTKLDFYEALTDNHEDAQIGQENPLPLTQKEIKPLPEKELLKKNNTKAEKRPVKKTDPPETALPKPSRKPPVDSRSKAHTPVKAFTIQAASVKDVRDADRLVADLKKKGFHAYRAIGKVPGKGIWYRVRVGDYQSRASAGKALNKLKKAGLKPILVEK